MDMISPGMYIFVIFIAGIAGFIDAVAGGGGVITMPAYMFAGIPPHNAYAINKLAARGMYFFDYGNAFAGCRAAVCRI